MGSLEVLTTNMEEAHILGKVFRTHLEHLFDGGRDGNRIVEVICEQHEHRRKAFRDVVRTRYLRKKVSHAKFANFQKLPNVHCHLFTTKLLRPRTPACRSRIALDCFAWNSARSSPAFGFLLIFFDISFVN